MSEATVPHSELALTLVTAPGCEACHTLKLAVAMEPAGLEAGVQELTSADLRALHKKGVRPKIPQLVLSRAGTIIAERIGRRNSDPGEEAEAITAWVREQSGAGA